MQMQVLGLHHITAIANNAKANFNFYTKILGMRLVKKTVNFDDPGTYHFYYGDAHGSPGTILTFFPWEGIGKGRKGSGMATDITYAVPSGSLSAWEERLKQNNIPCRMVMDAFDNPLLQFEDPDGLSLTFSPANETDQREGWLSAEVSEGMAIKGFERTTLNVRHLDATASLLTEVLGYESINSAGNIYRFQNNYIDTANVIDIKIDSTPGYSAAGTNHHVAFRVRDEEILMAFREKIRSRGLDITPKIDRDYFYSLYFREPGGVLFEIATDNPGFTRDEPFEQLGSSLKLPKQYEAARSKIEQILPPLD